jgi:hypothetical protein
VEQRAQCLLTFRHCSGNANASQSKAFNPVQLIRRISR